MTHDPLDLHVLTGFSHREGVAPHFSSHDPFCNELLMSVKIEGEKGTKTCHVFRDGSLTIKKGGQSFY